ncbi:MAG TPA: DUF222 domain-containing protein, partial [Pseudonocardia sp.]|uniref:DUF222 domain-containing protein n=1 Tax=Pseudonocardia sp. TaxID=60912 RepID=UPI002BF0F3A4
MSESSLPSTRESVNAGMAVMRVKVRAVARQERVNQLLYLKTLARQVEHDTVALVAQMDDEGDFAEYGVRPAPAIADMLRIRESEARRIIAVARAVFPTTLAGVPLEPRLPATAMALAGWEIDQAHAEVIEQALRK